LLIPWVIPSVVAAVQWKVMFASYGVINTILQGLGIIHQPILWLGNPDLALFSVTMVNVWRDYPFMTVVLLAGLQTIPDELYEVAEIDGASVWQRFKNITLPLLAPVSLISIILLAIWSFNNFDLVFLITGGGPAGATEVLPTYVYLEAFRRLNPTYAAAIATIMLGFLLILTILYMRTYNRVVES
jgi:multiple sugar transport system permease protein